MSYDDFQRWVGIQAAKSPVKSAWFTALAAGLFFGVCEGALNGSFASGVLGGVCFGFATGVTRSLRNTRRFRRRFGDVAKAEDRALIIQAVRFGDPIEDLKLAPAVIRYAHEVIQQGEGWVATRGRVFLAIVPIGCTAFLLGAVSRHDIAGMFVWFVCGMLGLLRARKLPTAWRHNIERARTAATYAQRMSVKDLA